MNRINSNYGNNVFGTYILKTTLTYLEIFYEFQIIL